MHSTGSTQVMPNTIISTAMRVPMGKRHITEVHSTSITP